MYADRSGRFIITTTALLIGIAFGAGIGAGISFGATVYQDYCDDGEIFNGSIGADVYLGNTVGGLIAGAGVGLCTTLGAGVGVALAAGETLVVGGTTISGLAAMGISAGASFASGGVGYVARTTISSQETFKASHMLIEAGTNTASGMLSFFGGMGGGISGVKVPGSSTGISGFAKYHAAMTWFGVYPSKGFISVIENALKEKY